MFRRSQLLIGVAALGFILGGCKGESPTAPQSTPPATTTTPGGTPTNASSITLTASNATPLVDSTSIVTATVTTNGSPAPNGTAVEFNTTLGTFSESNANTVIRTTTNGVATATVSSALAGTAVVTAIVGSASKSVNITFTARPAGPPPPPNLTPTISSVAPTLGRPQGGEVVTINGTNFRAPVRVLFDFGPANGGTKEATIVSVTPTQIQVLTPGVDLGAGQQVQATIILINEAGTSSETRVTSATNAFTFQAQVLTPKITILSPSSGPIDGGTRVVIFGSGFQSPLKVQIGSIAANTWQDAQVINVTFDQIVFVTPRASDTSGTGSGAVTGAVDIRITNINSATQATSANAFRYTPKMQITSVTPTFGSSAGGTQIHIDGIGFNDPVDVYTIVPPGIAIHAQVIKVSGTEIIARMGALESPCFAPPPSVINVVNVDNGDLASSTATFTFVAQNPLVTSVTSLLPTPGSTGQATVVNPGVNPLGVGIASGSFGGVTVQVSPNIISTGTGSQNFTFAIPLNLTFQTQQCTVGALTGLKKIPTPFEFTFTNTTTGCISNSQPLIINPTDTACVVTPAAAATVSPNTLCPASTLTAPAGTTTAVGPVLITVSNTGGTNATPLTFTGTVQGANTGDFIVSPLAGTVNASGPPVGISVSFKPATGSGPGARNATLTLLTNDPANPTINVPLCGTATP